jgi:hypothetical protein
MIRFVRLSSESPFRRGLGSEPSRPRPLWQAGWRPRGFIGRPSIPFGKRRRTRIIPNSGRPRAKQTATPEVSAGRGARGGTVASTYSITWGCGWQEAQCRSCVDKQRAAHSGPSCGRCRRPPCHPSCRVLSSQRHFRPWCRQETCGPGPANP